MSLRSIVLILFSIYTLGANGQPNYRPGFIITNNLDTIHGKVNYRGDIRMCRTCSFKTQAEGKTEYAPGEIFGYGFNNDRCFETDSFNGKPKFFEVLIRGEISIYYYTDHDNNKYFLKNNEGGLIELKYFEQNVYFDGSGRASDGKVYSFANRGLKGSYLIRSQEFKEILKDTLANIADIADDIYKIKRPNHRDLINLADKYHNLIGSNKEKTIHHNMHAQTILEISVGSTNINFKDFRTEKAFRTYSLKSYTPLAYNMFFVGIGIQHASSNSKPYQFIKLPISFRYQYPGNFIKPHATLGLNFYATNSGKGYSFLRDYVMAFNVGASVKVYKNMYLSINFEGDLLGNPYFNTNNGPIFSQTISAGITTIF